MKIVQMIDLHANIQEVIVDKYVKYNMNGNEFNILMYEGKNGKQMSMVKDIYGALYTIPYQGDISSAEIIEDLDVNTVPNCILPALRYDKGSRKLKDAVQKLIGAVAEKKCQWYSNPEKYLLANQEYKFPDCDKDMPKDITYEGQPTLPVFECERYIAFKQNENDLKNIQTYAYMPYKPADTASSIVSEDSHIMFDPAPSMDSIIPTSFINERITNGIYNGYRIEVDSTQVTADVKRGTTAVTPVILPNGATLPVQTLVLPAHHKYNIHFAEDVNKLSEKASGLGNTRFTVSPLLGEDKSPAWLFRQGVAKLRNVKVGENYIVGEESRYADYVEADFHREHQKTRND